ncbi:MAG: SufS family cysteine desulfurase [Erysipelotrichaceae bacterium]
MDTNKIRKDFPMLNHKEMQGKPLIYFDNAATTFKPQSVIDTVVHYYEDISVNAHRGDYELSFMVDTEYEDSRKVIGEFIHAEAREIIFTSGASGSLNLVAYGYGRKYLKKGDVVLSTEAEHASNILPWMKACEETGAIIEYIPLDDEGHLSIENFKKVMHDKVKVVAIAHVTNVLGFIVPIKEICAIAHEYGAKVIVDGAQSLPHMPVNVKDLDCDFFAFSAHKMCGPTGVGVLYGKYDLLCNMDPFMLGGGSNARFDMCGNILLKNPPYKFEAGTPAIEAVLGMKAACLYLNKIGMENIQAYEHELRTYMIQEMKKLDNTIIYNEHGDAAIITFNVKDIFAQDAATYFNSKGIAVRSGQHCAKLLMERLATSATIRASLYFYNTKDEIDEFIKVLATATLENCLNVFF